MTVGESIIQWLYTFGNIDLDVKIDTDQLESDTDAMALYKEPTKTTTTDVVGNRDIIERYYLLARQPTQTDGLRLKNQAWMESLEEWVYQQNIINNLPTLDADKTAENIEIAISSYVMEQNEEDSIYQISVAIEYEMEE